MFFIGRTWLALSCSKILWYFHGTMITCSSRGKLLRSSTNIMPVLYNWVGYAMIWKYVDQNLHRWWFIVISYTIFLQKVHHECYCRFLTGQLCFGTAFKQYFATVVSVYLHAFWNCIHDISGKTQFHKKLADNHQWTWFMLYFENSFVLILVMRITCVYFRTWHLAGAV